MKKIDKLRKEALESCKFRGHTMERFTHLDTIFPVAVSTCKKCNKYVQINTHPAPNDIDIDGTAVALSCSD